MKNYFNEIEFHGWYDLMDPMQLELLNKFRHAWGGPVLVSPLSAGVGRRMGPDAKSFHNVDRYGVVKATDIMPSNFKTKEDFKRGFEIAKDVGFLGIGIYPDWNPSAGMHVDVGRRAGRFQGNPAKWSAFKVNGVQTYFPIDKAFQ